MSSTSSSPTEKKSRRPKADEEHPRFGEFYDAYPVHKARGAAVRAFNKAIKKADPRTLIAGARLYAKATAGIDPRYIKHPATWLNQECWLDEPTPAPGLAATGTDGVPGHGPRAQVNSQWANGQGIEL
jgi:hypothetical protein